MTKNKTAEKKNIPATRHLQQVLKSLSPAERAAFLEIFIDSMKKGGVAGASTALSALLTPSTDLFC